MLIDFFKKFFQLESRSGILLLVATLLGIIWNNNSDLSPFYQSILNSPIQISIGSWHFSYTFLSIINEGLMTFFFLLVGLELKREIMAGELASWSKIILPAFAALGGMLIPALLYTFINRHDIYTLQGWAIPVATDIAFALGVVRLFGTRIPLNLILFLLALAIFDDVGAIFIIAIYHTHALSFIFLLSAVGVLFFIALLNYFKIKNILLYLLMGLLLWICILKSGVHATLAGVLLAFMIPIEKDKKMSPAYKLENALHPWVAFLIIPLFALFNAGISLKGLALSDITHPITLGIIVGLFLGKQMGVICFAWIAIKLKWAHLPENSTWFTLYGIAVICGIGFTMSLFLGTLAFNDNLSSSITYVRLGVLLASLLSGIVGALILHLGLSYKKSGKNNLTSDRNLV